MSQAPALHDRTAAYEYSTTFKRALNQLADKNQRYLNHDRIAALQIPNTQQSLSCYAWMASFFDLVGDKIPNANCEIHLEPVEMHEIYDEVIPYAVYITLFASTNLNFSTLFLWSCQKKNHFVVKILVNCGKVASLMLKFGHRKLVAENATLVHIFHILERLITTRSPDNISL